VILWLYSKELSIKGLPLFSGHPERPLVSHRTYNVCQKFLLRAAFKIPLNPPLAKGDFQRDFAKFPPLTKGGLGGIWVFGVWAISEKTFAIPYKRPFDKRLILMSFPAKTIDDLRQLKPGAPPQAASHKQFGGHWRRPAAA
jgi:hypothetical protein